MGDLFSGPHIVLIALMLLLLFGGKKIPELMRGLGKGVREFKDAKDNVTREMEDHINNNAPANNGAMVVTPVKQVSSDPSANG